MHWGTSPAFAHNGNGLLSSVTDALQNTTAFTYNLRTWSELPTHCRTAQQCLRRCGPSYVAHRPVGAHNEVSVQQSRQAHAGHRLVTGITTFTYDRTATCSACKMQSNRERATRRSSRTATWIVCRPAPIRLLRQESLAYDLNGNLVSGTDRRNKVTTFQYDSLNRRKFAGYGTVAGTPPTYESTSAIATTAATV